MLYIAIAVISKSLTFLVLISCLLPTSTLFPYTTLFRSYQRTQRFWKDQFARRVRFDVGDDARPRILAARLGDRKSTRLNSSHRCRSYAVFCLKKNTDDFLKLWDTDTCRLLTLFTII